MIAVSTIPVEISDEASRHIEQLGLQEPLQRMLDEIPKRFQAVHWIKVGLEHIVDEAYRPVVAIDVARVYAGRDDPSGRQFGDWVIETFAPETWEHLIVDDIFVEPDAR